MEWWVALAFLLGGLLVFFVLGMPVAFCFLIINLAAAIVFWGGEAGIRQLMLSLYGSIASFTLLPLMLFILMGEILFETGMALETIDTLDKWLGRLPGRLGLLAVGAGTLLATLTGASMASVAILGSALTPEMEKRGYKKSMSLGPIMGSGALAPMIPPSSLSVLMAVLAGASVAGVLIGAIIPGLIMAGLYATYIIIRCWLQPELAPSYDVPPTPLSEKLKLTAKYVLPLGAVIFMVTGIIILGVATPSEAAATGALGSFILAAYYRKLNWRVIKKVFQQTLIISGMIFIIISASMAFSNVLSFSGASEGLTNFITSLPLAPIGVIILLQILLIIIGGPISPITVLMALVPLFVPVLEAYAMDPVWFCVTLVLNVELSNITPPYGSTIFVMEGVAPPDTTLGDIFNATWPWVWMDVFVLALLIAFPQLTLWLPGLIR
jgi:tripartite ATP-independent transporter DctM subunit